MNEALTCTSAFLLGFAGSAHCVGMCGPLQLALPLGGKRDGGRIWRLSTYHLGRLSVYVLLGIFAGMLGLGASLLGWQPYVSLAAAIMLGLYGFASALSLAPELPAFLSAFSGTIRRIHLWLLPLWKAQHPAAPLALGAANGLLPCGMVYLAMTAACSLPGLRASAGFMLLFGMGTLPLLLLTGALGNLSAMGMRPLFNRARPILSLVAAAMLLFRGLGHSTSNVAHSFASPKVHQTLVCKPTP